MGAPLLPRKPSKIEDLALSVGTFVGTLLLQSCQQLCQDASGCRTNLLHRSFNRKPYVSRTPHRKGWNNPALLLRPLQDQRQTLLPEPRREDRRHATGP